MDRIRIAGIALTLAGCVAVADGGRMDARPDEHDAADEPPALMYVVTEHVKPSMLSEYDDLVTEVVDLIAAEPSAAGLSFTTVMGPEVGINYVMPCDGFADFERVADEWAAVIETIGDRFTELEARALEAVDHAENNFYLYREDLSYEPESPRVARADAVTVHYTFWYVIPGHEEGMEQAASDFVELYRSRGLDTGWRTYMALTGSDLPLYVVVQYGMGETDFYENRDRLRELLGVEGDRLAAEAFRHGRRLETPMAWMRRDLSYPRP